MDGDALRREILILAGSRWTPLWEALLRANAIAPSADPWDVATTTSSALSGLADLGAIRLARVPAPGPQEGVAYPPLTASEIAEALNHPGWRRMPPESDVWFTTTPKGERKLESMLGIRLPHRRLRALGRVVAGFADGVWSTLQRRHQADRPGGYFAWHAGDEGDEPPDVLDDDAGLAGSRVPRRPPDRSGSGSALAVPEPEGETDADWMPSRATAADFRGKDSGLSASPEDVWTRAIRDTARWGPASRRGSPS
jgi:hypothetical protein